MLLSISGGCAKSHTGGELTAGLCCPALKQPQRVFAMNGLPTSYSRRVEAVALSFMMVVQPACKS